MFLKNIYLENITSNILHKSVFTLYNRNVFISQYVDTEDNL